MPRLIANAGTTDHISQYNGHQGEISYDSDKKDIVVHDGVTKGGFPKSLETAYSVMSAEFTNNSTNMVNVTGASCTITTSGNTRLYISTSIHGVIANSTNTYLLMQIDGAAAQGETYDVIQSGKGGYESLSFSITTNILAAGSHTIQLRAKTDSGTSYLATPLYINVQEIR